MTEWVLHRYHRLVEEPITMDSKVCYEATDYGPAVLCSDLPKWLHKLNVATWSPIGKQLHFCEWCMATVVFFTIVPICLRNYKTLTGRTTWKRRPLPWIYLFAALYHLKHYEFYWGLPQRGWATTPCHLGWIVRFFMHCVPLPEIVHDVVTQVLANFTSLAFLFIFEDGEVGDAMYDGVFTWSLIHHVMLITIPFADILNGYLCVLPKPAEAGEKPRSIIKNFARWHMASVAIYLLMYVSIFTPVSLLSGVNWGWTIHFHATKVAVDINLTGQHFRLWWLLYYNILFVIFRTWWLVMDILLRGSGLTPYSESAIAKRKQAEEEAKKKKLEEEKTE